MIGTLERPRTTDAQRARLSVSQLTAGHDERLPTISDVSFDLPDGGLLAVVGPSGVRRPWRSCRGH